MYHVLTISHHIQSYIFIIKHHVEKASTQAEGAVRHLRCLQPVHHHLNHEDEDDDDHDHGLDHNHDDGDGDDNSLAIEHLCLHLLWYLDPISPAVPEEHYQEDER